MAPAFSFLTIFTILLVPSLSAPSSMNFSASSNELIPPAALIFVPLEILSAKIFTTWNVAPSVEKPVESVNFAGFCSGFYWLKSGKKIH